MAALWLTVLLSWALKCFPFSRNDFWIVKHFESYPVALCSAFMTSIFLAIQRWWARILENFPPLKWFCSCEEHCWNRIMKNCTNLLLIQSATGFNEIARFSAENWFAIFISHQNEFRGLGRQWIVLTLRCRAEKVSLSFFRPNSFSDRSVWLAVVNFTPKSPILRKQMTKYRHTERPGRMISAYSNDQNLMLINPALEQLPDSLIVVAD